MGLFDRFKKNSEPKAAPDLSRLTSDGRLPYGWHYANRIFTKKIEAEFDFFCQEACDAKAKGVKEEYSALLSLIKYREDVQRLCAKMGETYTLWASLSVTEPTSMEGDRERLRYLEENMKELLKHEAMIRKLRKELVSIIKNEPGIIQSDIYKRYDPSLKNAISNELYLMGADNTIIREKSGRSYKLCIKQLE